MATLSFDRAAVAAASSFQVLVAVGPQPQSRLPQPEAKIGNPVHVDKVWRCWFFRSSQSTAARLPSAVAAAACRRPQVTARSKAAGSCNPQEGTQTSAHALRGEVGEAHFFQFQGSGQPPAPEPQAENGGGGPVSCGHRHMGWSPNRSAMPSRKGHAMSLSDKASRRRMRTRTLKSGLARCKPRASHGGACSQAPAPGACES